MIVHLIFVHQYCLVFIFIVFVLLFRCYPIILIGPKLRPKAHFCLPKSVPKAGQQWTQQDPISRGPNSKLLTNGPEPKMKINTVASRKLDVYSCPSLRIAEN